MDSSDWIAVAAVVVSVVSGGAAVWYARRSVAEATRSADHAGASVVEARRSADEAAKMRELDEGRRAEEKERWHHDHEPDLPGEIEAKFRRGGPGDAGALHGEITVPRLYRVRADAVSGLASTQIALDGVTKPGQAMSFMIERWSPGKARADTEEIVFRFWPPVEGVDGSGVWACNCGRPGQEAPSEPAHWERRVKVTYRRTQMRSL
jgi:hypothetical protein